MLPQATPFQRVGGRCKEKAFSRVWKKYRLRWKRRRFLLRVFRKRGEITCIADRTSNIRLGAILAFSTVRNESERLPYFLDYYRRLGVDHFLIVDNDSSDGTLEYLSTQSDVSVWLTKKSYRLSRFGVDWLGALQFKFGHRHWCLTVDADELLVYPNCENRSLPELTQHLDKIGQSAFGAVMLELFPKGPVGDTQYAVGQDPIEVIPWFDGSGYQTQFHHVYENEWIQGGVRLRSFFSKDPGKAPTLNKIPLVKWNRRFAYVNSTHQILPTRLHNFYDPIDGCHVSGALLHTKFLPSIVEKSREETERKQHFENSELYQDYYASLIENPDLWSENASKYVGSHQLVELGLISDGFVPSNSK